MNIWVSSVQLFSVERGGGGGGTVTPTAVTCSVKACNHKKFIQDNNISVKFKNMILNKQKFRPKVYIMYQSIPSLTIPPPQGDPRGFAHSSCPWGRVFTPLSCPGVCTGEVLNQNENSIILKKARFLLCHLNKGVTTLFMCLYVSDVSSVTLLDAQLIF